MEPTETSVLLTTTEVVKIQEPVISRPVSQEKANNLMKSAEDMGLDPLLANNVLDKFLPFFESLEQWKITASGIKVTDESQTSLMRMAGDGRKAVKKERVSLDHLGKGMKEAGTKYNRFVGLCLNEYKEEAESIENYFEHQETFIQMQAKKRREELRTKRGPELAPYSEFIFGTLDLGLMSEEQFQANLANAKILKQAKADAEKKAEEERLAREKEEEEERERVRLENERIRAELAEANKKLAEEKAEADKKRVEAEAKAEAARLAVEAENEKERAKVAAEKKVADDKAAEERSAAAEKLRIEQAAKAKLEKELKAIEDARLAEEKRVKEAEKKAKAAPDKAKLLALADVVDKLIMPEINSEEALAVLNATKELLAKVSKYVRDKASVL